MTLEGTGRAAARPVPSGRADAIAAVGQAIERGARWLRPKRIGVGDVSVDPSYASSVRPPADVARNALTELDVTLGHSEQPGAILLCDEAHVLADDRGGERYPLSGLLAAVQRQRQRVADQPLRAAHAQPQPHLEGWLRAGSTEQRHAEAVIPSDLGHQARIRAHISPHDLVAPRLDETLELLDDLLPRAGHAERLSHGVLTHQQRSLFDDARILDVRVRLRNQQATVYLGPGARCASG